MQRLWEVTVSDTSYPASAQINFLASDGCPPTRLRVYVTGGMPVYLSRDGTNDHDFLHAGVPVYEYDPMLVAAGSLWIRLVSAGSAAVKVVEY